MSKKQPSKNRMIIDALNKGKEEKGISGKLNSAKVMELKRMMDKGEKPS